MPLSAHRRLVSPQPFLIVDHVATSENLVEEVAEDQPGKLRAAVPGDGDLSFGGGHEWSASRLKIGDAYIDAFV